MRLESQVRGQGLGNGNVEETRDERERGDNDRVKTYGDLLRNTTKFNVRNTLHQAYIVIGQSIRQPSPHSVPTAQQTPTRQGTAESRQQTTPVDSLGELLGQQLSVPSTLHARGGGGHCCKLSCFIFLSATGAKQPSSFWLLRTRATNQACNV